MADRTIEDAHHVARHVKRSDFEDDKRTKLLKRAFEPRFDEATGRAEGVSVNWIEYHLGLGTWEAMLEAVRRDIRAEGRTVTAGHRLAILDVGRAKAAAFREGLEIDVEHKPRPGNPSHSEITGIPVPVKNPAADRFLQRLAAASSERIVPA